MTWLYVQQTGALYDPTGALVGHGYSGNGDGLNNPDMQTRVGVGPIPCGRYTVGPPHQPIDHLGPCALPLWPDRGNSMFGRCGFYAHGDNFAMNHTASNGCLIFGASIRASLRDSMVKVLVVVATEKDLK